MCLLPKETIEDSIWVTCSACRFAVVLTRAEWSVGNPTTGWDRRKVVKAKIVVLGAAVAMLGVACAPADGVGSITSTTIPEEPSTTLPNGIEGPVFIESTEILYLESYPVQVRLLVRGGMMTWAKIQDLFLCSHDQAVIGRFNSN